MLEKRFKAIFLCFMILVASISSLSVHASMDVPTQYETLIVGPSGDYEAYFPGITKCPNGDLIAVYYWNTVHVGTEKGIIRMIKSTDNGLTWGTPVTIVGWRSSDLDVRDPHINTLSNGDMVLSFFSYRYGDAIDVKGSYFSKSTDYTITLDKTYNIKTLGI